MPAEEAAARMLQLTAELLAALEETVLWVAVDPEDLGQQGWRVLLIREVVAVVVAGMVRLGLLVEAAGLVDMSKS